MGAIKSKSGYPYTGHCSVGDPVELSNSRGQNH